MFGKYFSKNANREYYLPGEEFQVEKQSLFSCWFSYDSDPVNTCKIRLIYTILGFAIIYLIIAVRLFDLCIISNLDKNDEIRYKSKLYNNIRRADIVDRNGTIVATSLPTANLYANPRQIINPEKSAQKLVDAMPELNYETVLKRLKQKNSFAYLDYNITPSQQQKINYLGIPGIYFEKNREKRVYLHQNLLAHIVGNTNRENEGISGIERKLEERLSNSDIPLQLSIDIGVQDTIREILHKGVKKYSAQGAVAILMNVNTAEIISMISLPDFNPNDNSKVGHPSHFNRATMGVYEPGSVLKVFNTAMALESGKVKVNDKFDATKPLDLKYMVLTDYHPQNKWLSVPEILIHSSNVGSVQMALKAGINEQHDFFEKIGFLDGLDIEIAEKGRPLLPPKWNEPILVSASYGYAIAVSPLHLISAYSAIVNGGIYHSPTFLKNSNKSKNGHRVISDATSKTMRKLLRLVVTEGSGRKADVVGYEVGGKTGTAKKTAQNGGYERRKVNTTFLSAFPISEPQYALIVTFDNPQGIEETFNRTEAGWNAVPISSDIIKAVAPQLNLQANYDLQEIRQKRIIEASWSK